MEKNKKLPKGIHFNIVIFILCRLLLNTAKRFLYPFAPLFSRKLQVPLSSISALIALNQSTSIIGLFIAPLGDKIGYKIIMLTGMLLLITGMLGAGIFPTYGVFLIALFLSGMAKSIFDPALQAYAGQKVPFNKRGYVIGLLELSWAGSLLIGVPSMGFIIENIGWKTPFFMIATASFITFILIMIYIPNHQKSIEKNKPLEIKQNFLKNKKVLGMLGFIFLISLANDNLFITYGVWFEQDFHLSITSLGIGVGIIGLAELLGEFFTVTISDKIGLKNSVIIGTILTILAYSLLPMIGKTKISALFGLFLIFIFLEYTVVCSMSLSTEVVPRSRSTMMGLFFAAAGGGRVIGALLGGFLWEPIGITGICIISSLISTLGLLVFWLSGSEAK